MYVYVFWMSLKLCHQSHGVASVDNQLMKGERWKGARQGSFARDATLDAPSIVLSFSYLLNILKWQAKFTWSSEG